MKIINVLIAIAITSGCYQKSTNNTKAGPITVSSQTNSGGAFLTKDARGNPVLCWTEGYKGKAQMFFSTFNAATARFGAPVAVPPSLGTGVHTESMNKIAFKGDGSIIAVYEKKHPTETNKYAGSILYTQSFDHGKSWTRERYLHTDTVPVHSRSFFDIAVLADGEVGAVWVDGRVNKGKEGSSLFFAKTMGRTGFGRDKQIGETVCECCRTDLYTATDDKVHIVFRDIESTIEGQVRDFGHLVTTDHGLSFSVVEKVSNDKWLIEGCPHTGASVTDVAGTITVAWFTGAGVPGLYYTSLDQARSNVQPRDLLSAQGKHPQLSAYGEHVLAAWEEIASDHDMSAHTTSHDGHSAHVSGFIAYGLYKQGQWHITELASSEGAEFPVLQLLDNHRMIIAYTQHGSVKYQIIAYSREQK